MSIYRGWRYLPADIQEQDVTDKRTVAEPLPPTPAPVHLRRAQPVLILLPRTANWLAQLPPKVRPRILAAEYARIVNAICAAWNDPPACRKYFEDLLVDRRGGRRNGFPMTVLRELQALRAYHGVVHPTADCAWDVVEPERDR